MYTRKTSDYSPTMKGSKAEQQAIRARKEMLAVFASIIVKPAVRRLSWAQRMEKKAKGYEVRT